MKTLALPLFVYLIAVGLPLFATNEVPKWVIPINGSSEYTFSKYEVSNGYYMDLIDEQSNYIKQEYFNHYSIKILTNAGVSNTSQLAVSYDTAYQEMSFHYLYIWRNGKKIDKSKDVAFNYLNQELQLSQSIYNGRVTAHYILNDIRVGDKIEYAYTLKGDNPIFESNKLAIYPLQFSNPVSVYSMRILYDNDQSITEVCVGCEDEFQKKKEKDFTEITLRREGLEAIDLEKTIPVRYLPIDYFHLSTAKSWIDISSWAERVFRLDTPVNFDLVFEEIFLDSTSLDDSINAAIDYVQNKIRYMGIESGIGSIKPFHPNQVIAQRFGDCKDKSLLLVHLLKMLGVESAYPALVSTRVQAGVGDFLPGAQLFDHCIVNFSHAGRSFWIDATTQLQGGGYQTMTIFDYELALLVKKGENKLTRMKVNDVYSRAEVIEEIDIQSHSTPSTIKIKSRYFGSNADQIRRTLEYVSVKDLSDQLKSNLARLYPNISVSEKLKVFDDFKENVITLTESYNVEGVWDIREMQDGTKKRVIHYEPLSLYNYMGRLECEVKKFNVVVGFPANYRQVTSFLLPEIMDASSQVEEVNNAAFWFKKKVTPQNDNKLTLEYTFRTKTKEIKAEEFSKVCSDQNAAVNKLPLILYYPLK